MLRLTLDFEVVEMASDVNRKIAKRKPAILKFRVTEEHGRS